VPQLCEPARKGGKKAPPPGGESDFSLPKKRQTGGSPTPQPEEGEGKQLQIKKTDRAEPVLVRRREKKKRVVVHLERCRKGITSETRLPKGGSSRAMSEEKPRWKKGGRDFQPEKKDEGSLQAGRWRQEKHRVVVDWRTRRKICPLHVAEEA